MSIEAFTLIFQSLLPTRSTLYTYTHDLQAPDDQSRFLYILSSMLYPGDASVLVLRPMEGLQCGSLPAPQVCAPAYSLSYASIL